MCAEHLVSIPSEANPAHKKVVRETFSEDAEYWRKVYEEPCEKEKVQGLLQGGVFVNREMVDRKNAVLGFIEEHAGCRKVLALDLGCGSGMTMRDILERGHAVIGADITEAMLNQARAVVRDSTPGQAQLILSDAENIPFEDNSFDVVLCVGVLQYLQTDQHAVREMSRVVRDGGLVVMTLPNIFRINNLLDPYYYLVRGVQFIVQKSPLSKKAKTRTLSPREFSANGSFANRRYYYGQLSRLFERSNLRHVHTRGIAFGPLTFWRKQLLPTRLSMSISRLLQWIALKPHFSFVNAFANRWVICLKKVKAEA